MARGTRRRPGSGVVDRVSAGVHACLRPFARGNGLIDRAPIAAGPCRPRGAASAAKSPNPPSSHLDLGRGLGPTTSSDGPLDSPPSPFLLSY